MPTPLTDREGGGFFSRHRWLPFFLGAVIAVIAILVIAFGMFENDPYKDPVKHYWESYYFNEAATVDTLAPDAVWAWIAADTGVDKEGVRAFLTNYGADYRGQWCARFGNDLNLSMEIVREQPMTAEELATYKTTLVDTYGIAADSITKATVLTVDVTLQGELETRVTDGVTMIAVEIDGVCYVDKAFGYAHQMAENAAAKTV